MVGFVIEGIGSDTAKPGGIAWSYSTQPTASSDYEWRTVMVSPPESINSSINLFEGAIEAGAYRFQVAADDTAATSLLALATDTNLFLDGAITDSTTSLTLSGDGSTGVAGTVVFVEDEAILLGTHTSGGTYTGCTRGLWETYAAAHDDGVFVYERNPYTRFREVKLVVHDLDTGTEEVRWRGFIESISADQTTISVSCLELLAALKNATINRGSPRLIPTESFTYEPGAAREVFLNARYAHTSRVRTASMTSRVWLQVGDTMVPGTQSGDEVAVDAPAYYTFGAPPFEFDADDADTLAGGVEGQLLVEVAHELFVVDVGDLTSSSSQSLSYPAHPVALAYAFMTGGDWGAEWSLNAPTDWFDTAAIDAVIESDPSLTIDRLLLGWDGEEVNLFEMTNNLLRAQGYQWGRTQDGRVTIVQFRAPVIDEFCAASQSPLEILPERLQWNVPRAGQFNQVSALVGGLPWRDPDKIVVKSRDGRRGDSVRRGAFAQQRELEFDFSMIRPSRDPDDVLPLLINAAALGYSAMPTLCVAVVDPSVTGVTYDLGAKITVDSSTLVQEWLVDREGNRVRFDPANASLIGTIVGMTYEMDRGVYLLDLLLTQWSAAQIARWRAPSAIVSATPASLSVSVEANAFHAGTNDATFFAVGDEIEFWYADGVRVSSTVFTITNVGSLALTVTPSPIGVVDTGHIVRLANLDDYSAGASHLSDCDERPFVFMADETDLELGTVGDTADIYG